MKAGMTRSSAARIAKKSRRPSRVLHDRLSASTRRHEASCCSSLRRYGWHQSSRLRNRSVQNGPRRRRRARCSASVRLCFRRSRRHAARLSPAVPTAGRKAVMTGRAEEPKPGAHVARDSRSGAEAVFDVKHGYRSATTVDGDALFGDRRAAGIVPDNIAAALASASSAGVVPLNPASLKFIGMAWRRRESHIIRRAARQPSSARYRI